MRAALLPFGCEQSNARMPLTYSRFAILLLLNNVIFGNGAPNSTSDTPTAAAKAILDPKRRNDLVDEAFMEQKDILLDMLEAKLKEVRDKKKKRPDRTETSAVGESIKCELLPDDVDLKLQASGIIAVGETDVQLKFGDNGNSTLNLNASGISNVGKTNLNLGIGDGTINIPGLQNLFLGSSFIRGPCEKPSKADPKMLVELPSPPHKVDTIPNEYNVGAFRKNIVPSNTTNSSPASTSTGRSPAIVDSVQNNVTQAILASNVNLHNVTTVT